ncbi:eukaryotic translation initiation factor 3 subunit A [Schistocerca serialis cubense]|uniref:eukaryotic translation initiation factor 3 subunit A n=1 Tax=Schistocerca serialis cubense TaxID=2023355 RepID=UPI00214E33BD|nr:eukaryotic translation initiation factor 3 subunit A [Schistocerca serialis cubense]
MFQYFGSIYSFALLRNLKVEVECSIHRSQNAVFGVTSLVFGHYTRVERGGLQRGEGASHVMVYHRLDSGSSSSAAFQQESEAPRDAGEDSGGPPGGPEEGGSFPERRQSWEGMDDDRGPGNYRTREGRYSERSRSRNGRDERFPRSGFRSRDNRYYNRSRSRDRRGGNVRERERIDDRFYDSPKYVDRQRYRESSRYHRESRSGEGYEESSRYIEKSRYSEESRHFEDSRYNDSRYRDDQRCSEDSRGPDGQRYSEQRFRDDSRFDDRRYGENSRYDNEPRYSENSRRYGRHRENSGDDWHSENRSRHREERYRGTSRYSDDEAKYGESSVRWDKPVTAYGEMEEEEDDDDEEESKGDVEPPRIQNVFQNDGSFLEMFKKMQEANKPPDVKETEEAGQSAESSVPPTASSPETTAPSVGLKRPTASLVGKRRGGRVLPTGMVKKVRKVEEVEEEPPKDAWSLYMAEVRKYKEASCEEEGKTRPLVK